MRAGQEIYYENNVVVVVDPKGKKIYRGYEEYEPNKYVPWKFVITTKNGKGHYEWNGYKKYRVG